MSAQAKATMRLRGRKSTRGLRLEPHRILPGLAALSWRSLSLRQRCVGYGKLADALLIDDAADAEQPAQLAGRHEFRAGRGRRAGRRLRKSGGARSVKSDGALDLLHQLVDVSVQHCDRAETGEQRERLRRILRAPAPFRRDGPERDMREDDDRRRGAFAGEIIRRARRVGQTRDCPCRRP